MDNYKYERSDLALAALHLIPSSIQKSLISDYQFRSSYGLKTDVQVCFRNSGTTMQQSKLYNGIREVLSNNSLRPILIDDAGIEWTLELTKNGIETQIILFQGDNRFPLPEFTMLSPVKDERVDGFKRKLHYIYLPENIVNKWRAILTIRALTNDEMDELEKEIEETPTRIANLIDSEMKKSTSSLTTIVPSSLNYYECLVGVFKQSQNVIDYAEKVVKEHFDRLIAWRVQDGLKYSLLLSSHSSITSLFETIQISEKDLIATYEWLSKNGDLISQIGAIEYGLTISDKNPEIDIFVNDMIKQITNDSPENECGRFQLLSSLIMLVEGELSHLKVVNERPPFWRRLASFAQAALIERCIIKSPIKTADFIVWAKKHRTQGFYLQNMTDLRSEPYCQSNYALPQQLKSEFIGRIYNSAQKNDSKITSLVLKELLFGESPNSVKSQIELPFSFIPGPLEGGIDLKNEPPAEILEDITTKLNADTLNPESFAILVNTALLYKFDSRQALLVINALRLVKYQLKELHNEKQVFAILRGLATFASVTRSSELAKELRILTRRYSHQSNYKLSIEAILEIALITAAAYSIKKEWSICLGEWITELSFESLQKDELMRLHLYVQILCDITPDLWSTCGRADAALRAALGI